MKIKEFELHIAPFLSFFPKVTFTPRYYKGNDSNMEIDARAWVDFLNNTIPYIVRNRIVELINMELEEKQ